MSLKKKMAQREKEKWSFLFCYDTNCYVGIQMATQHNLSKFMRKMHGDGGTSKKGKIMLDDEKKKERKK